MFSDLYARIQAEPAVFWGHLTVLIEAVIGLALIFEWWSWSNSEMGAVMLVVAMLGSLMSWLVRSKVTPV